MILNDNELKEKLKIFNIKLSINGQILIKAKNGDTLMLTAEKKTDENCDSYFNFTGDFITKKDNKKIKKLEEKVDAIKKQINNIKEKKYDLNNPNGENDTDNIEDTNINTNIDNYKDTDDSENINTNTDNDKGTDNTDDFELREDICSI